MAEDLSPVTRLIQDQIAELSRELTAPASRAVSAAWAALAQELADIASGLDPADGASMTAARVALRSAAAAATRQTIAATGEVMGPAVALGVDHGRAQIALQLPPDTRRPGAGIVLPVTEDAVATMTAAMGDEVARLGVEFGRAAATGAATTLEAGIRAGLSPRQVGVRLRQWLDVTEGRAERIARTEILRASWAGQRAAGDATAAEWGVEPVWVWVADLSGRTCEDCLSLHGTVVDRDAIDHPNGRCVVILSLPGVTDGLMPSKAEAEEYAKGAGRELHAPHVPAHGALPLPA